MMGLPPGRKDEGMYLQAARTAAMAGDADKVCSACAWEVGRAEQ